MTISNLCLTNYSYNVNVNAAANSRYAQKTEQPGRITAEELNPQDSEQLKAFLSQFDNLKVSLAGNFLQRWIRPSQCNAELDRIAESAASILENFKSALEECGKLNQAPIFKR